MIERKHLRFFTCRLPVAGYMRRYRYCEYLGKFFCPRCHSNEMAVIPARVLHRWDFAHYHVSNFAHDLLRRMIDDPLYNVDDVNPALYQRVKAMARAEECRVQLYHLKAFLSTCRRGQRYVSFFSGFPIIWGHRNGVNISLPLSPVQYVLHLPFFYTSLRYVHREYWCKSRKIILPSM